MLLVGPTRRRQARDGVRDALRRARNVCRRHGHVPADQERLRESVARDADPDVILDVPTLKIDQLDLDLDELSARVALDARVLDLLGLHVGADASLGRVSLRIKGVEAEALLKVRLDNLAGIIDRVMDTVDRNPEILSRLAHDLGAAARDIGHGAGSAVEEIPPSIAGG